MGNGEKILPKAIRKIQIINDTRPEISEALRYLYFYSTAEDPEKIIYPVAAEPACERSAVSIHNHTDVKKSPGGSDGLDSFEDLLNFANSSEINILGITDHLSKVSLNSGETLETFYGQGLGFPAYRRWQELREAGKLRNDLAVLPGVELEIRTRGTDISGSHLIVLNATYEDFEKAFRAGDPGFSYSSTDERTMTGEIFEHVGRIGLARAARELSQIESVLVINPHPSVLFAGSPKNRKTGNAWEEQNTDSNLALMLGEEFRREIDFDRAYPAALMMGAIPAIETLREGMRGAAFFSSDSHRAELADFSLTYASGIDSGKYKDNPDPRNEIVWDLKRAISEKRLSGGINQRHIDRATGKVNREGRALLEKYFTEGKAVAYQTLSPQALGAANFLSKAVLSPSRKIGQYLSERGARDYLEKLGGYFGIAPEIYEKCRK